MNRGRRTRKEWILFAGDLVALFGGLWLALAVRHLEVPSSAFFGQHVAGFGALFLVWQGVFLALAMYELKWMRRLTWQVGSLGTALVANWIVGTTYFYF